MRLQLRVKRLKERTKLRIIGLQIQKPRRKRRRATKTKTGKAGQYPLNACQLAIAAQPVFLLHGG